jgi:hypothetical protein
MQHTNTSTRPHTTQDTGAELLHTNTFAPRRQAHPNAQHTPPSSTPCASVEFVKRRLAWIAKSDGFLQGHYVLGIQGLALLRAGADRRLGAVQPRLRDIDAIIERLDEQPIRTCTATMSRRSPRRGSWLVA